MSPRFEAPRGTHDVLPSEPLWWRVVREMEEVCALYGYRRIQTPGFEDTELFQRTSGAGSDVVQKETYTFTDRGDRSLTLRPEGTAPIARAYLEHGLHRAPQPVKLYTIAPMYRYAAPQRGRFREHWQLSVEAIGSADPAIDAEIIQLYSELLRREGVTDYVLQLNSIGDQNCRPGYVARLTAWLDEHDDELDEDVRLKRGTNPLRVFDVKSERMREVLAAAPKIGESLCEDCRAHFAAVRAYLDEYGVSYEPTPTLVRGLDYYSRTTFEFIDSTIGAQDSICGGGRYDGLVEELGGDPTPGIGFGAGIERLLLSIKNDAKPQPVDLFIVMAAGGQKSWIIPIVAELRRQDISVDLDYAGRSLKGQVKLAERLGVRWIAEYHGQHFDLRERGKPDERVPVDELVGRLRELA